jgi:hypothetical protein
MPIYTTICTHCGRKDSIYRSVAERDVNIPECAFDGNLMRRAVEAPAIHADLPGYQSPIDGSWIEGRRARTEDLKRNNCRPWEGMSTERNEAIKRADEADKKFETSIEKGIADTFNNMSVEKQRVLNEAIG